MASQGPNNPGTADEYHNWFPPWTNPDNVKTSNNTYATFQYWAEELLGYYSGIKATQFGFSIPSEAIIDGIMVEIERKSDYNDITNYIKDAQVRIVKDDGSVGSLNKADTSTKWPTSNTYKSYGSTTDKWGETWDRTKINDSDFGVIITTNTYASKGSPTPTAFIDHIRITVYYTESGGEPTTQLRYLSDGKILLDGTGQLIIS